jgi:HSP20 family protein
MALIRWQRPETTWSGLDQLDQLRRQMDQLLDLSPFGEFGQGQFFNEWAPAIDLFEDKDQFIVKAEIPGMKKEDIDVSLHNDALTISGERKYEEKKEEGANYRTERFFGRFQRTVTLPKNVAPDKVKASYKEGILTVTVAKSELAKPKQIEVQVK